MIHAEFEIHDPVGYSQYSKLAQIAIEEFASAGYQIEPLSGDDHPKIYEGAKPANHLMVVKFKSREDYETFLSSESYQRALPHRLAASTTQFIMAMDAV